MWKLRLWCNVVSVAVVSPVQAGVTLYQQQGCGVNGGVVLAEEGGMLPAG